MKSISNNFNKLASAGLVALALIAGGTALATPYIVSQATERVASCVIQNSEVGLAGQYTTRRSYYPGSEVNWIQTKNCGTITNHLRNDFNDPAMGIGRYANDYKDTFCNLMPGDTVTLKLYSWPPNQSHVKEIINIEGHNPKDAPQYAVGPHYFKGYCAVQLQTRVDAGLPIPPVM